MYSIKSVDFVNNQIIVSFDNFHKLLIGKGGFKTYPQNDSLLKKLKQKCYRSFKENSINDKELERFEYKILNNYSDKTFYNKKIIWFSRRIGGVCINGNEIKWFRLIEVDLGIFVGYRIKSLNINNLR